MAAGAICSFFTNSEPLLQTARRCFAQIELPVSCDFSVRFWVDNASQAQPPWPQPYVRGLDNLVFAGFDADSSMLADLRTRRVIGRFSSSMAADTSYWKTVIFPILLSIVGGSLGLVELHASCVAKDQRGILLLGPSHSGKSTLAMALTQVGFEHLSDDRTLCSVTQGELVAWGLPRPIKLRQEAAVWFDHYRDREPTHIQNGEPVFHHEPRSRSERQHTQQCVPQLLVFLEQQEGCGFSMTSIERSEARSRIERDLLAESAEALRRQSETLDYLLLLPCRVLRFSGTPQVIAQQLATCLETLECTSPGGLT